MIKSVSKISPMICHWMIMFFTGTKNINTNVCLISSVYIFISCEAYCLDCTQTCHFWSNVPWWWFRVFNDALNLELIFGFCVSSPAPLRNTNMAIIWICLASVTGLVTFLAVVICRKRQEEYFELSAFIFPAFLCNIC